MNSPDIGFVDLANQRIGGAFLSPCHCELRDARTATCHSNQNGRHDLQSLPHGNCPIQFWIVGTLIRNAMPRNTRIFKRTDAESRPISMIRAVSLILSEAASKFSQIDVTGRRRKRSQDFIAKARCLGAGNPLTKSAPEILVQCLSRTLPSSIDKGSV